MAVILKRVAALARNRASPEAIFVRWYNPLHLAQKKPHDLRAEGRRQAAAGGAKPSPQPPSGDATDGAAGAAGRPAPRQNALTQAATASAVARHAAGEALTLAELIRMQEAGHSPALPSAFLAHASTVRTYQGASPPVGAAVGWARRLTGGPAGERSHWTACVDCRRAGRLGGFRRLRTLARPGRDRPPLTCCDPPRPSRSFGAAILSHTLATHAFRLARAGSSAKVRADSREPKPASNHDHWPSWADDAGAAGAPAAGAARGPAAEAAATIASALGSGRRRQSEQHGAQQRAQASRSPSASAAAASATARLIQFDLRPRELVALLDKYVVKQVRALLIGSLSLSRSLERAWRPRTRVTRVTRVPSRVTRRATGATRVTPRASRHLSRLTPVTFPVVDPPPSPLPLCRPASLPYRLCAAPYQAEAKKVLAVAVCDHYNHARACLLADAAAADGVAPAGADGRRAPSPRELEHTKPNVLLLGSTGVGKTYLMRTLARLIGARPARAPTRGASRASLALLVLFQRVCACVYVCVRERESACVCVVRLCLPLSPFRSFSLMVSSARARASTRTHTHTPPARASSDASAHLDTRLRPSLLQSPTTPGTPNPRSPLARAGVPFVRADATKFTATGYVGRDPEDLLRDLLPAAVRAALCCAALRVVPRAGVHVCARVCTCGCMPTISDQSEIPSAHPSIHPSIHRACPQGGDLALAQHGIIYVDEIDKLCTPSAPANGAGPGGGGGGGGGGNIHTRDVQNNFLKLLEDTDVPLEAGAHSQQVRCVANARERGRARAGPWA
jgi:hypothetical protein